LILDIKGYHNTLVTQTLYAERMTDLLVGWQKSLSSAILPLDYISFLKFQISSPAVNILQALYETLELFLKANDRGELTIFAFLNSSWVVTTCGLVSRYQCFGETCCIHSV
jgi:hypothetical protein